MMNERALRVLEFNKILGQLADFAVSEMGHARCLQLRPAEGLTAAEEALQETEEAQVILTYLGSNPLVSFPDVQTWLAMAAKGASLSPKALLEVARSLAAARAARSALVTERENTPRITALASALQPARTLEEAITGAIISEEEISDHASPALYDIRRHIRQANEKVREKLNSMVHGGGIGKYLQENIVTVRNGRYVIPVKQEYRQFVPGLVHDQSGTGATLFIEPMAVVELGNELKQWTAKEREEIERILSELSAQVGAQAEALTCNAELLTQLDLIFAKGQLSRDMNGVLPHMNEAGRIRLKRARHPLIPRETVVPCDLWLGQDFTTLIVTGPNTGGKTVTLKVTDRDLVLFDELGAGTDPTEGAALAQTILDTLLRRGVRTLATTHYSELKAYALSTPGVENASVEFDVSTLRPTFRLSIGVPGKSNAFEISRRLGLSEEIIERARELLSANDVRFEDVIAGAEYQRQIAERERTAAEQARAETVRLRDEAETLYREMEEKRRTSERKAKEEARRIVENARRDAETVISELKRMKKEGGTAGREAEINALRRQMQSSLEGLAEGLASANPDGSAAPKSLKVGDLVDIVHLNTRGTVLSVPDERGEVQLQAGIMKLRANISQLRLVQESAPKKQKSTVMVRSDAASRTVRMECDVRGMALGEALIEVEKYLDQAVMAGMNEVAIVHGKGTGTLRQGIQQHLKKYPHVKSFRLGQYGEGESGVTIVTLN